VIDDIVEPDLGQRDTEFLSGAVDGFGGARQIRPEIDDWDNRFVNHPLLP
jgi:hypothetical protein